jgi:type IX secretion system PorP/SprF family membrane protein
MQQIFIALCFLLHCISINAQQIPMFSQPFGISIWNNPALTGVAGRSRIQTSYRNQWPQFNGGLKTIYAGCEFVHKKLPLDIGLYQMYDDVYNGIETNYFGGLSVARSFKIADALSFRLGITGTYTSKSIEGPMLNPLQSGDPSIPSSRASGSGILLSGGFVISGNYFLVGYSIFGVNQPTISLGSTYKFQYRIHNTLQTAIRFPLYEKDDPRGPYLNIQLLNAGTTAITSGLAYRFRYFKVGFGYRQGNTFIAQVNTLIGSVGYIGKKIMINYSYDYVISKLTNTMTSGAHEITLSYQFGSGNQKRPAINWISSLF